MPVLKLSPFIVIEALDAGGSQTQADLLCQRLQTEKYHVLQLHFPQEDRATGRFIYDKFLLSKNKGKFSRREQALIYLQDFYSRANDIRAAQKHSIVLSDRFCTSTFAYQTIGLSGSARRRMMQWLQWLAYEGEVALPQPDCVIFLDTPIAVSVQRLEGKQRDFFETKEKLTAIRSSYLKLAKEQGWHTISSVDQNKRERTREEVHQDVWAATLPLLNTGKVSKH